MVSFVCDACQEALKKPKLDLHKRQCYQATFSCIDCGTTFQGTTYKQHTSCITEAEKYQKALFKGNKNNKSKPASNIIQSNQSPKQSLNCHDSEIPTKNDLEKNKKSKSESNMDMDVNSSLEIKKKDKKKKNVPLSPKEFILAKLTAKSKQKKECSWYSLKKRILRATQKEFPQTSTSDIRKWIDSALYVSNNEKGILSCTLRAAVA